MTDSNTPEHGVITDDQQPPPPSEGLGELLHHPHGSARDTRLIRKAVEGGWPIKPELREAIVDRLGGIISKPETSAREVVNASKAVIAADSLNLQAERIAASSGPPAPTINSGITIVETDDWYGTKSAASAALFEKAQQYGLTNSRLKAMIENNGDAATVQDRVQAAIAADPEYAEYLRLKELGLLPTNLGNSQKPT